MRRATTAAQLVLVALVVRNWAYVTTYRLYLDRRVDSPARSVAAQQFDVDGQRVVPRIAARAGERLAFAIHINQDATVYTEIHPASRVNYSIRWRDGGAVHTIASGVTDHPVAIASAFPGGNGIVELVSDGAATWIDPRVVRSLRLAPHFAVLGALFLVSTVSRRRSQRAGDVERAAAQVAAFRAVAVAASALLTMAMAEAALRATGDRLPAGIAAERHDLGELTRDARWEPSPRYERRLRTRVDAVNEWRYGDIVRMGFIPPSVSPGAVHRFHFVTDAEGFRNASTREHFDIAALGDSFTDAMTMDGGSSWPSQLERRLGVAVQNYGTAGFGPQQELLVLGDYVAAHRPRIVVLAFFAGNDIFDAEAFEAFQLSHGRSPRPAAGWRVKDVYSRADTWYLVSALKAGAAWVAARAQPAASAEAAPLPPEPSPPAEAPAFDRGMYTATVAGRRIQWAFMPPYLNTLNFSEGELRQRRGWALTRDAVLQMQQTTAAFGGQFVVMFLPFKSQVHWRLLERTLPPQDLRAALAFALEGNERPLDIDAMRRNRLAQNRLMRALCESARIPFLDTTSALEARLETGENVYFPDESHFNETGQAVVAEALAAFLRETRLAPRN
jgi:lysophospholipase L1-like esterase